MISIAIVEDSSSDAAILRDCILRYGQENNIRFEIKSFENAVDFLECYRSVYDVIFMDIQMPYYDGISASRKLREMDNTSLLVFVTSLEQYALKGYEVSALDYIIKPINYESMSIKLRRIVRIVHGQSSDKIAFSFGADTIQVRPSEIMFFDVMEHNITVHFSDQSTFLTRKSLAAIEKELPCFIRINHYTLVNPKYITRISGLDLYLSERHFDISRARKKAVTEQFTSYLGSH